MTRCMHTQGSCTLYIVLQLVPEVDHSVNPHKRGIGGERLQSLALCTKQVATLGLFPDNSDAVGTIH